MLLTNYVLESLAAKVKAEVGKISVLQFKMDSFNGCSFWVLVDGETRVQQVRLGWLK
jgi:hypothetical protein